MFLNIISAKLSHSNFKLKIFTVVTVLRRLENENFPNDENGNKNKPAGQYSNGLLRFMIRICGFFVSKISKAFVVSRFLRFRNLIKQYFLNISSLIKISYGIIKLFKCYA